MDFTELINAIVMVIISAHIGEFGIALEVKYMHIAPSQKYVAIK